MIEGFVKSILSVIHDAIDSKAAAAGNVTVNMVMTKLDKLARDAGDLVKAEVSSALAAVQRELPSQLPTKAQLNIDPSVNLDTENCGTIWPIYEYVNPNTTTKKNVGKK